MLGARLRRTADEGFHRGKHCYFNAKYSYIFHHSSGSRNENNKYLYSEQSDPTIRWKAETWCKYDTAKIIVHELSCEFSVSRCLYLSILILTLLLFYFRHEPVASSTALRH